MFFSPCNLRYQMVNFFLALFSLYFSLITLVTSSASTSSSPTKPKYGRSMVSISSKKVREPAWFKKSTSDRNAHTWNVFGQWFNQFSSKPFGGSIHLKSIRNVNDFCSFVSTKQLNDIDRIDVSIFRPGFEPDFEKFIDNHSGYVLSYKVDDKLIQKSSSPSKISRNEAKTLAESASPTDGPFNYMRVFDPLITAAIECEYSNEFPSEIIGFLFKRLFKNSFIQIFFDGNHLRSIDAHVYISKFISGHFPFVSLQFPRIFRLSSYSSKILRLPLSNFKSDSHLKIKEEEEEDKKGEVVEEGEDVKLVSLEESGDSGSESEGKHEKSPVAQVSETETILDSIDSINEFASESSENEINLDEIINEILNDDEINELSSSLESFETAEEDKKNFKPFSSNLLSNYSLFARKTIQDQIFDIIFTEDFEIFLKGQKELMEHFSKILVNLELENFKEEKEKN